MNWVLGRDLGYLIQPNNYTLWFCISKSLQNVPKSPPITPEVTKIMHLGQIFLTGPRLITFLHCPLLKSGSNSTPNMSTRIQFLVFGLGTSHSKWWIQKSHYSIPTLMQNPTEFTSRVFKKQCFWRKKWLTLMCETLNFVFLSPPPTLSCAPFVCIVPVFSEDLVEHNFQSFA